MIEFKDIIYFVAFIIICYASWDIFNRVIFPRIVLNGMKEVEKNPKWITSKLYNYYGFSDIDIILCESKWGMLPRFRTGKNNRLELLIDPETSVDEVEDIGRLALAGKIKTKYGVWVNDKPLHWMSILCYMLDGGDVNIETISKEEAETRNLLTKA